jgi:hypothetical protein
MPKQRPRAVVAKELLVPGDNRPTRRDGWVNEPPSVLGFQKSNPSLQLYRTDTLRRGNAA